MIYRVFVAKKPSRTYFYLEDIPELAVLPYGDHDAWSHQHSTGFYLRFTKQDQGTWLMPDPA